MTVDHLNIEHCELKLDADWSKGRREEYQPLPQELVRRLGKFIAAGRATELYEKFYTREDSNSDDIPESPLLYFPTHAARSLYVDLAAAGIAKETKEGKVDFHACRTAYISHILGAGATVKEAQTLARHTTPSLTMNTYGRAQASRLTELVEQVGEEILNGSGPILVQRKKAVAKTALVPDENEWRIGDLNP